MKQKIGPSCTISNKKAVSLFCATISGFPDRPRPYYGLAGLSIDQSINIIQHYMTTVVAVPCQEIASYTNASDSFMTEG